MTHLDRKIEKRDYNTVNFGHFQSMKEENRVFFLK